MDNGQWRSNFLTREAHKIKFIQWRLSNSQQANISWHLSVYEFLVDKFNNYISIPVEIHFMYLNINHFLYLNKLSFS